MLGPVLAASLSMCVLGQPAPAGTPVLAAPFDSAEELKGWNRVGPGVAFLPGPGPSGVEIARPADQGPGSVTISRPLDIEHLRGCRIRCEAFVRTDQVSPPPKPWNGVKFMLHTTGGTDTWQQRDLPGGNSDWKAVRFVAKIPTDAKSAELVLGLEEVTGRAVFDRITLTVLGGPRAPAARPVGSGAADRRIAIPRLRGAMIRTDATAADLRTLGGTWKANHIRWQLTWGGFPRSPADHGTLAAYDAWLNAQLDRIDALLPVCKEVGLHVLIDLHTPPGGRDDANACLMFQDPKYQAHFLAVWDRIVRRYAGNPTVWGYDLVNEPVEGVVADGLKDWQALALETAQRVRAIDKDHAIIVEPAPWGGPGAIEDFEPLPLPGIVYSVHMYEPHKYTHQGVYDSNSGIAYPGPIAGRRWDKDALREVLRPVVEFQKAYNVPIYIGEFSVIRWAPGAEDYLRDVIDLFEEHGWDWAYHAFREWDGWSVEHGPDKADRKPAASPPARETLLRSYFERNRTGPSKQ